MIVELCRELVHHLKREISYPPPAGQRVWDWFWELDKGRQIGMQLNAISWSDLAQWQKLTGADPEPWEIDAIYRMGIYRIDPDHDPIPKKEEPVSFVSKLKDLKASYEKNK